MWAYWHARRSVRYSTIRPRTPGVRGRTVTRTVPDAWISSLASVSGSVAEAIRLTETFKPGDDSLASLTAQLSWRDYFDAAVADGGAHDKLIGGIYWDNTEVVRDVMLRQWPAVTRLAGALVINSTVQGREGFAILDAPSARW